MRERRRYAVSLVVNGCPINEVVIDPHYEIKHPDINDALILELVRGLDGKEFQPEDREGDWEFFILDRIEHQGKRYRLVWCMRDASMSLGVINCFRR
jgi:hypothetical protein